MTTWARSLGVSLLPASIEAVLADPALQRALLDGVEYGYEGPLPPELDGATWYLVREGGSTAGALALVRDMPQQGEAALLAIAIAPEHRGRATGTKALLAAERRLLREGMRRLVTRVPRANGRGLYFMLRAGFTPIPPAEVPADGGDATWFARHRSDGRSVEDEVA